MATKTLKILNFALRGESLARFLRNLQGLCAPLPYITLSHLVALARYYVTTNYLGGNIFGHIFDDP